MGRDFECSLGVHGYDRFQEPLRMYHVVLEQSYPLVSGQRLVDVGSSCHQPGMYYFLCVQGVETDGTCGASPREVLP